METSTPREGADTYALVPIPGLGPLDVAVIQSLLEVAGFFHVVQDGPGEEPSVIYVRATDAIAVKRYLADYTIVGTYRGPGGPIPW